MVKTIEHSKEQLIVIIAEMYENNQDWQQYFEKGVRNGIILEKVGKECFEYIKSKIKRS